MVVGDTMPNLKEAKRQLARELGQVDRLLAKINRNASRDSTASFQGRKRIGKALRKIAKAK